MNRGYAAINVAAIPAPIVAPRATWICCTSVDVRRHSGRRSVVMIVAPFFADSIRERLTKEGVPTFAIGEVREGEAGVEWVE